MDLTAPSFSLGIDFDDPPPPAAAAGSDRRGQARGYEAPDAPSFSLGIDDDDWGVREPQLPAGSRWEEQAPRYEAPDAPSFSLGIDDDDGGGGGPHLPAVSRREEQARRYEAPDPPSFSLGLDDDEDDFLAGGQRHEQARPQVATGDPSWPDDDDEDDGFLLAGGKWPDPARGGTLERDSMPLQPGTTRLKRLRRGPAPPPCAPTPPPPRAPAPAAMGATPDFNGKAALGAILSLEDDIEDLTTDDERPPRGMPPSVGSCRTSSNSKSSLLNNSVLTSQSTSKSKTKKFTQMSNSVASKPLEESCTKKLLPKITVSPLRKIHLLDSDTDSDDNKNQKKAKKPVSPIKRRQESTHNYVQKKPTIQHNDKSEGSTIVQKSNNVMNDSWATPALDEFCSEYFKSVTDSRLPQQKEFNGSSGSKVSRPYNSLGELGEHFQQQSIPSGGVLEEDLTDSQPPAMHYFFHHDLMVQKLVRERLPHFIPIGTQASQGNEYSGVENLNYRNQFGRSGDANDRWVTPNRRTSVPTDVGKRRVHASGSQSGSGHWFTGEDGRKVYVSKNGQELTGRGAYLQFKKESGKYRKSRKKSTVKKEGSAGAKRGSSTGKRSSTAKRKR